ncbi:MAG: LL-diaminopimelate aminotransferase [Clostridiales bacterium]|nr:LL-diaminopimelate aminotransferase [Clostridiales bacterium]
MINQHYRELQDSYLFSTIARKVSAFQSSADLRQKPLIRMGIGDVTHPLCPAVVAAMKEAVEEMGRKETFRGYGPEQGYDFLRDAVRQYYAGRGVLLNAEELFISDGAKSDVGNILDLFEPNLTVCIPDPVYPVYVDTNTMDGRSIVYLDANEENGFLPLPDQRVKAGLIYLCSPNNPTGAVYSRDQLKQWVDYANGCGAVILFDAAYEAFIHDSALPRSIFEIEGARTCAVEFCSLSKTAGFTGTRCGYTVVPDELEREGLSINRMWLRRQTTKFNGVSYVVQRGAEAVFTPEGQRQTSETIAYYRENARIMAQALAAMGVSFTGGAHSPYIWLKCPDGLDSWSYFDRLLREAHVVGTPGVGFGRNGEGFFRLTAFGTREDTEEAMRRMQNC